MLPCRMEARVAKRCPATKEGGTSRSQCPTATTSSQSEDRRLKGCFPVQPLGLYRNSLGLSGEQYQTSRFSQEGSKTQNLIPKNAMVRSVSIICQLTCLILDFR